MKKNYLIFGLLICILMGCQSRFQMSKIKWNEIEEIKVSEETSLNFTAKEDIEIIANAMNNGIEIEGILDVSPSNLVLEIIKKDGNSEIIWLWLENDDSNAMFMFADESSIGYNILKEDKAALLQLIFENQQ